MAQLYISTSARPRQFTVLAIDGIEDNVAPALQPLALDELAMSDTSLRDMGLDVGATVARRRADELPGRCPHRGRRAGVALAGRPWRRSARGDA
jgi:hypothetical protein